MLALFEFTSNEYLQSFKWEEFGTVEWAQLFNTFQKP
jgi:hypothetical protein